jgi:hypothetical protein
MKRLCILLVALVATAHAATFGVTYDPGTYILKEPTAAQLATGNQLARTNTAQTWSATQTFNAPTIFGGTINFGSAALTYAANQITWASVNKSGASLTDLPTRLFADLQSKPTTAAGYGITNGAALDTVAANGSAYYLARANHTGTQAPSTIQVSATARILGRTTAGAGGGEELTAAQAKTLLAIANTDVTGLAASATTDTTNAANITTGTLSPARLPGATTSTQGAAILATSTEVLQGQDTAKVVTPLTLASATSVPVYAVTHFRDKLAKLTMGTPNTQLRVLVFGDSVANLQVSYNLLALAKSYGDLGTGASPTASATGDVIVNNGGGVPYNYTYSLSGSYTDIGTSGTATWARGGATARADTLKVYYIKEPGAGTFKVQLSTDGVSFADESGYTSVSASIGSGLQLGIITIAKTVGNFAIRVVGLTGRVKVLATVFGNTTDNGVIQFHLERGGLGLDQANSMDSGLFTAFMQDLAPDIAFFQMKEGSTFATDLATHITRFNAALPNMDWVYLQSTPDSGDTGSTGSIWQNAVMRTQAVANGNAVIDLRSPTINYATCVALGWVADGTHPGAACNQMLAEFVIAPALGLLSGVTAPRTGNVINGSVKTASFAVSSSYAGGPAPFATNPAFLLTTAGDLDATITTARGLTLTANAGGYPQGGPLTLNSPIIAINATNSNAALTISTPSGYTRFNQAVDIGGNFSVTNGGALATFGNTAGNNWITVSRITTNPSSIQIRALSNAPDINFTGSPLSILANGTTVATFGSDLAVTLAGKLIVTASATPASAAASGALGTIGWDTSYIYIATASNTWKRAAISTW